jgi:hypothetical protein
MHGHRRIGAVCALALLTACGDDGTGPGDDTLTDAEIVTLMETIGEPTVFDPTALQLDASGRLTLDEPCPQGGRVTGSGSISEPSQSRLAFDASLRFRACRHETEAGLLELDGTFRQVGSLQIDASFENVSGEISLDADLDWRLGDRSGTCAIDMDMSFEDADAVRVSGTICGQAATDLYLD